MPNEYKKTAGTNSSKRIDNGQSRAQVGMTEAAKVNPKGTKTAPVKDSGGPSGNTKMW
jgi:hypothetical protein